ncbi:MAG: adenylate kinase [Marinilabiliaceae bacterium]|jgi:adenylate kinase|nr:adenylate kinase [Marinilabiliaceae bacterium]
MANFLIFGPPGSGKGTQSELLSEKYNLVHLSTGDMLREEIASVTSLGQRVESIMSKGELVPDEVVIEMIGSRIEANTGASGFLFDGFPRTVEQAIALDEMLAQKSTPVATMLVLEVEHDELVKRLLKRAEVSGRTDDMDTDIIKNRIAVYSEKTAPVASYYNNKGTFDSVPGMGDISDIFARLCKVVDKYI